jgi:processive 1,2-diacylglycerol beta-glucosyltransferase
MRFLVVLKSITSGVSYHRLIVPLNRLKQKGYDIEFINTFNDKEIKESDYDYLVFNRSLGYGFKDVEIIEKFKNEGVKIILDIDDYWELPQHHPIVWRNDINYEEWKGSIMANISYADYIWTSTEELKQKIKGIAPTTPIIVSRNAIDYADPQWKSVRPKSKNKRDVVIGYAGSTTHYMDLDIMKNPIRRLNQNKTLRNKIMFHLFGVDLNSDYGKIVWKHQIDVFTGGGKSENLMVSGGIIVYNYSSFYEQMDIALAPLLDNDFNRCKSELKILEAGSKYKPFIGTDMITYSRASANIDLCSSEDDWVESIKELVMDKQLRESLGRELGEFVRDEWILDVENQKRLHIL